MKYLKKNYLLLKHIFKMTLSNPIRLVLSISGLFVGLLIFNSSNIIMDSYYNKFENKAEEYLEDSLILKIKADNEYTVGIINKIGKCGRYSMTKNKKNIANVMYSNGYSCVLNADVIGISSVDDVALMDYDESIKIPVKANVVKGRWINEKDVASKKEVVVIDDLTAEIMFGNDDCIGKKITIGDNEKGMATVREGQELNGELNKKSNDYEIIGVFANDELVDENNTSFRKFKNTQKDGLILNTSIYIPLTCLNRFEEDDEVYDYLLWTDLKKNLEETEKKLNIIETLDVGKYDEYMLMTKNEAIERTRKDLLPTKIFMFFVLGVIFVISGINTMNILFFSVKERMGEIGIKKTMGASTFDIIYQFMLEGLFAAYIAGALAGIVSIGVVKMVFLFIDDKLFMSLKIVYTWKTVIILFILSSVYGIVFSLLPSYYGAKSKITETLRFE